LVGSKATKATKALRGSDCGVSSKNVLDYQANQSLQMKVH